MRGVTSRSDARYGSLVSYESRADALLGGRRSSKAEGWCIAIRLGCMGGDERREVVPEFCPESSLLIRSGLSSRAGDRGLLQSSTALGSTLSFLDNALGDLERRR